MADERQILIDVRLSDQNIDETISKLKSLERDSIEVKLELDVDGKKIQTDINSILKDIQNNPGTKLNLSIGVSDLEKQLSQAEAIVKKSAKFIQSEFSKITKASNVTSLRQQFSGGKTFSKNITEAEKQLTKYRTAAIQAYKATNDFDSSDVKSIEARGKAIQDLITTINDVDKTAKSKNLSLPQLEDDYGVDTLKKQFSEVNALYPKVAKEAAQTQVNELKNQIK